MINPQLSNFYQTKEHLKCDYLNYLEAQCSKFSNKT